MRAVTPEPVGLRSTCIQKMNQLQHFGFQQETIMLPSVLFAAFILCLGEIRLAQGFVQNLDTSQT